MWSLSKQEEIETHQGPVHCSALGFKPKAVWLQACPPPSAPTVTVPYKSRSACFREVVPQSTLLLLFWKTVFQLYSPCGSGANTNFTVLTQCEGSIRGHVRAFAAQSSRFFTETSGKIQLKQRKLGEKVRPLPRQLESGRRCWGHRKGVGQLLREVRIGSGFSLLKGEGGFGNVSGRK